MQTRKILIIVLSTLTGSLLSAQANHSVMSEGYWAIWNQQVQEKIDRDINRNRKADAVLQLKDIARDSEVKIEQVSHDFIFGAHIFNFDQLGTTERNRKYKELFGTLFNSATIAFYWKTFEMEPGKPRFKGEYRDTEAYWNKVKDPKNEPHWRRPASDPVVEFCESKGIRMHGHTIIWGQPKWNHPDWLFEQFCPEEEKEKIRQSGGREYFLEIETPDEIAKLIPVYTKELERLFEKRVVELAQHYGGRLHSWDIVNESARDYHGNCLTGYPVTPSRFKVLMPGDYTYHAFKTADRVFPKSVALNINDYANDEHYANQVLDLLAHGARIDILGSQLHLFNSRQCLDIAEGKELALARKQVNPQQIWDRMATLAKAGLPMHLSEVTITSPGDDARGREIQAVIARNLYRLWFSIEQMMGITWWNIVDDCGAAGEPSNSGLFTRDMEPKPAYHVLNQLINHEWKTNLTLRADTDGKVQFRGFKGKYRVTWIDRYGRTQTEEFYLKQDGDGMLAAQNPR